MKRHLLTGSLAAGFLAAALTGFTLTATAVAAPSDPTPAPTPAVSPGEHPRVAWFFLALTDVQRRCLADQAVQRPAGRLTEEQRDALRSELDAALATCAITLPERLADLERVGFGWAALSPENQQCLAGVHVTRPLGRLTPEQRAGVRAELTAAIQGCVGR